MSEGTNTQAPENHLPEWKECCMRVENSCHIEERISEGGFGFEEDGYYANEIHKFIYEYDDADPYRSAWFLHRLEKLINFVKAEAEKDLLNVVPLQGKNDE